MMRSQPQGECLALSTPFKTIQDCFCLVQQQNYETNSLFGAGSRTDLLEEQPTASRSISMAMALTLLD